jgi:hypothetical protein
MYSIGSNNISPSFFGDINMEELQHSPASSLGNPIMELTPVAASPANSDTSMLVNNSRRLLSSTPPPGQFPGGDMMDVDEEEGLFGIELLSEGEDLVGADWPELPSQ